MKRFPKLSMILVFLLMMVGAGGVGRDLRSVFAESSAAENCHEFSPIEAYDAALEERIDNYLMPFVAQKKFYGSVLIAQDCKILFKKSYGFANVATWTYNTPHTKFREGSIGKTFTAIAILQLQERGLLKVTDKIHKYLPTYPTDGNKKNITIHHLLTHTSGIPDYPGIVGLAQMMNPTTSTQVVAAFKDLPLEFVPGRHFSYSSSGYFLLGLIIEAVSGRSYAEYVEENILRPVGMDSSGLGWSYSGQNDPERATGYFKYYGNLISGFDLHSSYAYAAGDVHSTVEDMYLWDSSFYTSKLLTPKSRKMMFTPYIRVENFTQQIPNSDVDPYYWGYGVLLGREVGRRVRMHGGDTFTFRAYWGSFPDEKVVIILNSNISKIQVTAQGQVEIQTHFELFRGLAQIFFSDP